MNSSLFAWGCVRVTRLLNLTYSDTPTALDMQNVFCCVGRCQLNIGFGKRVMNQMEIKQQTAETRPFCIFAPRGSLWQFQNKIKNWAAAILFTLYLTKWFIFNFCIKGRIHLNASWLFNNSRPDRKLPVHCSVTFLPKKRGMENRKESWVVEQPSGQIVWKAFSWAHVRTEKCCILLDEMEFLHLRQRAGDN